MRAERGFALVLVLWALILLTTIGMAFGFAVRIESASGVALSEQVQAEAIATAGVRRAILGLLVEDNDARWKTDGRVYDIPWPDATLRATMRAENSKIDINHARQPLLEGLFAALLPESDPEVLAAAVLDWRDRDDRMTREGAERDEYAAVGRRGPANARFASVEELAQVLGFDGTMLEQLRPYITVYGQSHKVNALTADVAVLAAIPDISGETAGQFVAERDAAIAAGEAPDLDLLRAGNRYLDRRLRPLVVNIRANARLHGGAAAAIDAVVLLRSRSKPYEILDWRQPLPDPAARAEPVTER
jgi:general secretion pathway protein K